MPYQNIHPARRVSSSANFNNIIENTRFIDDEVGQLESKNTDQDAWKSTVPDPAHEDIEVKLRDLENYYGDGPGLFGGSWQTNNLFDIDSGSNLYLGWDTELVNSGGIRMVEDYLARIEVAGVWAIDATVMVVNESTSNNFGIWIGLDAYNGWAKSGGEELDERQVSCVRYFNEGDYFVIGYYSTNSISLQNNSMQPMLHAYRIGSGAPPVRPPVDNPWVLGESTLGESTILS